MLEKIKYINHRGEVLNFGTKDLFVNENDLRDFAWDFTSKNNRISSFKKGIVKKKLPVILKAKTEEEGYRLRDKLFEVFEKDVLAEKHGTIIIGDYYLKCFVTASAKTEYLIAKSYMKTNLVVTTDFPYWIKETTTVFNPKTAHSEGTNLDYNRDFPSDYTTNLLRITLDNTGFMPCKFIMNIYGPCANPSITIAGHEYAVNIELSASEYLTIDSVEKTIIQTKSNGSQVNCYNLRKRSSYIFEQMPVGISNISTNGNFIFDITLLEERSEPKWQ